MGRSKGPATIPNRAIYSRISYLYQAATLLNDQAAGQKLGIQAREDAERRPTGQNCAALSRRLLTDLRSVCLKTQLRAAPAVKQTVCKACDSLLVEGETCSTMVENPSTGGTKPWADILVRSCRTCGHVRRYPVQAKKQKRRSLRQPASAANSEQQAVK